MAFNPRQTRLAAERDLLAKLNEESDHVRTDPFDVLPGSEPEKFRVTLKCKGIVGVDSGSNPIYGQEHRLEIHCTEYFPAEIPLIHTITPIWHPNIDFGEPNVVCANGAEWIASMTLVDLCLQLFEMVQYKNYHAEHV